MKSRNGLEALVKLLVKLLREVARVFAMSLGCSHAREEGVHGDVVEPRERAEVAVHPDLGAELHRRLRPVVDHLHVGAGVRLVKMCQT